MRKVFLRYDAVTRSKHSFIGHKRLVGIHTEFCKGARRWRLVTQVTRCPRKLQRVLLSTYQMFLRDERPSAHSAAFTTFLKPDLGLHASCRAPTPGPSLLQDSWELLFLPNWCGNEHARTACALAASIPKVEAAFLRKSSAASLRKLLWNGSGAAAFAVRWSPRLESQCRRAVAGAYFQMRQE